MMAYVDLPLRSCRSKTGWARLDFISFAGVTTCAERGICDAGMACAAEDVPSDIVDFVDAVGMRMS